MYVGGTGYGLFEIISQQCSGWSKKNNDQSRDSLCPGWNSNGIDPEYKTAALALELVLLQNNYVH